MIVLDRGTDNGRIVKILRDAGAAKVHVRSSCPPIRFPCHYGIDFPWVTELIYGSKENSVSCDDEVVQQVCEEIGADSLLYQTIDGLIESVGLPREDVCLGCLTGDYWFQHDETERILMHGFR